MRDTIDLPEQNTYQVFSEGTATGNLATIFHSESDTPSILSAEDKTVLCELASDTLTICHLNQTTQNLSMACFNQSGEIQRCGHGALAAGAHLDRKGFLQSETALNFANGQFSLRKHRDCYWFSSDTDIQITAENCLFATELVHHRILETATSMGESGYLIVRLSDDTDLRQVQPNLNLLKQSTKRALILTSAQLSQPDIDYQIRYFAPQYGVIEDSATGSANEIAAYFWHEKINLADMRCYQASEAGGCIYINYAENRLWVGGKVRQLG